MTRKTLIACFVLTALFASTRVASAVCLATGKACGASTSSNDRLCCPGMICGPLGNVCQAGCRIGGTAYRNGAVNPSNACQTCQASRSTSSWSNVSNGTACNDGNQCTQTDTCVSGACTGGNPVVCTASNVCHTAGACNPATGVCSNPAKADGFVCDDGNACNGVSQCAAGSCNPSIPPVVCAASDACHAIGTCAPATGLCSNPAKADGSTCPAGLCCAAVCVDETCCAGTTCPAGAPRVVATTIQENAVIAAGSLNYQATFSQAMRSSNLDSSDFSLSGQGLATSYSASSASFNAAHTVLSLGYADLPEDDYALKLFSGDGELEDTVGDLDGEPVAFPIPPNQSGNGTQGGDFAVNFTTDFTTRVFPALTAKLPLGSLVYDPAATGAILPAGDSDNFTILLDAGQVLSVLVTADSASLRSSVVLRDPSSAVIGSATAAAAGDPALLASVPIATAGTYTISISGDSGTKGRYTVQAVLNAALENEGIFAGSANDSTLTAQSINASAIAPDPTNPGAVRMAVLGGNGAAGAWEDYYSFTFPGPGAAMFALKNLAGSGTSFTVQAPNTVPFSSVSGPANVNAVTTPSVFPLAVGTAYIRVQGSGPTRYNLLALRGPFFELEPNNPAVSAQVVVADSVVLGHAGQSGDEDWFVLGTGGTTFTTLTPSDGPGEFGNTLDPHIRVYDAAGTIVLGTGTVLADGRNEQLVFTPPAPGVYRVRVTAEGGTSGEYVLRVGSPPG